MRDVRDPVALRPLGFGEIFDRAITLYLRNFWPFVGIVLVALIPLAVMQYGVDSSESGSLAQIVNQVAKPNAHPTPLPDLGTGVILAIVVGILVALLVQPLVYGAVAYGVERLYKGEAVTFRSCVGTAWSRWPRLLGLVVMALFIGIGVYIGIIVIVGGAVAMALVLHGAVGTAIVATIGAILVIAAFFAFLWVFASLAFALFAIVVEDVGVFEGIRSGFRRVFNRSELWRALGIVVCSGLINLFAGLLLDAVALIVGYFGLVWLEAAIQTLSSLIVMPFSIILMAVYYFDVRVRREGLDFERRRLGLTLREE